MIKRKNGVSPIIGYVLLVAGIIAVSALIYPWMKSYVPKESVSCQEGASLFLKSINCIRDTSDNSLILKTTLRNNGLFNLDGFMIYGTDNPEELATVDLAEYAGGSEGLILFKEGRGSLEPNEDIKYLFKIGTAMEDLKKVEIIPTRFEIINNKKRFAICGKTKIEELVTCVDKAAPSLSVGPVSVNIGDLITIEWDTGDESIGEIWMYKLGDEINAYKLYTGSSGTKEESFGLAGEYVIQLFAGTEHKEALASATFEVV